MAGILLLLVVVGLGCWLGVRAFEAKSGLEQARNSAQQAKDALLQGDTGDASKWADEARSHAQAARDATHSLPWNIAAVVPWLGSPFKTGQQISDVVLGLAADVLQPSADVSAAPLTSTSSPASTASSPLIPGFCRDRPDPAGLRTG